MQRYDRRSIALAVGLSGLAGYVDALGYQQLRGYFVSFMSGNSTRLGVGFGQGDWAGAAAGGAIVLVFVVGVVLGALLGHRAGRARRTVVIAAEAFLLAAAAGLHAFQLDLAAVGGMVLAMGCENAVFQRDGEVSIGLTYMTGALVKMGQRLAGAFLGGPPLAWLPHMALWAGLVVGAVAGSLAFGHLGLQALWIAALLAAVLAGLTCLDASREGEAG